MELTIHNVGHGLCISLIHENGNVMLWDCGHQDDCQPSEFLPILGVTHIDHFFVTNFDEDHISDLPDLRDKVCIRSLHRNKSISAEQLRQLKLEGGPITSAMASMLNMINSYTGGPLDPAPAFPGVRFAKFRNSYGRDFPDTNNISLVTFLECNGTKFIIPGDIEKKGWQELLGKTNFTSELTGVNVFVASHHGREDGYCEDVFDTCKPEVVVFSDSPVKHATQEMTQTYANHVSGITFNRAVRYVLSTRNDGSLTWTL